MLDLFLSLLIIVAQTSGRFRSVAVVVSHLKRREAGSLRKENGFGFLGPLPSTYLFNLDFIYFTIKNQGAITYHYYIVYYDFIMRLYCIII